MVGAAAFFMFILGLCMMFIIWKVVLIIDTVILWFTVKWRPEKKISWTKLKELYTFGWKMLCSSLITELYTKLYDLIIGKAYLPSDLAFYNQGQQFPSIFINTISSSMDSVLLPAMSKEQDDKDRIKNMTKLSIKVSIYIMAPLMIGLAVISEPLVEWILTDKWLPCVPYLRIFSINYLFIPIHTANLNAIKSMGRSDLFLKLEIIKKIIGLGILLITVQLGVLEMALGLFFSNICCQVINSWPNKKLLNYSYWEQLTDIFSDIFLAVFMGAMISLIHQLSISPCVCVVFQIIVGIVIYIIGSYIMKNTTFFYILNSLKKR